MKRGIAVLLVVAVVLAGVPCVLAASGVQTVLPEGNEFFFDGSSGDRGRWTSGRSAEDGLWAQSDAADGAASAVYVERRLRGNWSFNVRLTPLHTENDGYAVSRVQLLDEQKRPMVRLTYEYRSGETSVTVEALTTAENGTWTELYTLGRQRLPDTSLNFRFDRIASSLIYLTVAGNCGYTDEGSFELPVTGLYYAGFATEHTATRFDCVWLSLPPVEADVAAAAETAYDDLMKNFLLASEERLKPVACGMVDGTTTNTGRTVHVEGAGSLADCAAALMAMDTYAQYCGETSEAYRKTAERIANTVNFFLTSCSEEALTAVSDADTVDACGRCVWALLLGCRYNRALGRTDEAETCLRYAESLFHNTYICFYDEQLGGGLWENGSREAKSIYAAALALAGDELYRQTGDETLHARSLSIYEGIENNLRRADGLYSMSVTADGAEGLDAPYAIAEGSSCTYLGGNLCMAVLNDRLGNAEKAKATAEGIALFETTNGSALCNDRDAWSNTMFLGLFARELVQTEAVSARWREILDITASKILAKAVLSDGYYSAAWEGPKEPLSGGYPKGWPEANRNGWGTQADPDGLFVGYTPNQLMTTATTVHVLFAAAAVSEMPAAAELEALRVDGKTLWPVFQPEITEYRLIEPSDSALTLRWTLGSGLRLAVNGVLQTKNSLTLPPETDSVRLTVSSPEGTVRMYRLVIREVCGHEQTERTVTAATCTAAGSEKVVCTLCGETLSYKSFPPTGHLYTREETTLPSCVSSGSIRVICKACGTVVSRTTLPATGHSYQNGVCTRCGLREVQQTCGGGADCPSARFADLDRTQWYHAGVDYCVEQGLMNGVSATHFDPEGSVTRAMLVTVLYRAEQTPSVVGMTHPFTDVPAGQWYTDAVTWAANRGIVNGVTLTQFAPDDPITREQIAAIFYRYAKAQPPERDAAAAFPDAGGVSAYARAAMNWAVADGLINGMDGRLAPTEGATRAQIAMILARYAASIGK